MWLRSLCFILISLVSAQALAAQVIRGNLLDEQSGRPIENGTVLLLTRDSALVSRVVTDTAGAFLLETGRAGSYRVQADRLGYYSAISPSLTMGARDTLDVEFRLSNKAVVLKPLVVTSQRRRRGQLADFYNRAKERGFGNFITLDQIEKLHPLTVTSLLRRIPGVQLHPRAVGGGSYITVRGNCTPAIFIDGTRVRPFGDTVDDLVSVLDLEGIEVYKNAGEAPVQYTSLNPGCGVILFWTRID